MDKVISFDRNESSSLMWAAQLYAQELEGRMLYSSASGYYEMAQRLARAAGHNLDFIKEIRNCELQAARRAEA